MAAAVRDSSQERRCPGPAGALRWAAFSYIREQLPVLPPQCPCGRRWVGAGQQPHQAWCRGQDLSSAGVKVSPFCGTIECVPSTELGNLGANSIYPRSPPKTPAAPRLGHGRAPVDAAQRPALLFWTP